MITWSEGEAWTGLGQRSRLFFSFIVFVFAWSDRRHEYEDTNTRDNELEVRRTNEDNRRNSLNDTGEATSLPLKPRGQTFFILFFTWLTDLSRFNVVYLFPPPYPRPFSSTHAFFPSSFLHFAIASTSNFQIGNGQTGGKEKKGTKQRNAQTPMNYSFAFDSSICPKAMWNLYCVFARSFDPRVCLHGHE